VGKINPRLRDPAYVQVARILEKRIRNGTYPPDERIPSEAELMREFEIGRNTARSAVGELRKAGLVETESKRGTYVVPEIPPENK
jgi:DNA-binding GntR family transcriptional regulator